MYTDSGACGSREGTGEGGVLDGKTNVFLVKNEYLLCPVHIGRGTENTRAKAREEGSEVLQIG